MFQYDGTASELRAMIHELEFAVVPERFAIEGHATPKAIE